MNYKQIIKSIPWSLCKGGCTDFMIAGNYAANKYAKMIFAECRDIDVWVLNPKLLPDLIESTFNNLCVKNFDCALDESEFTISIIYVHHEPMRLNFIVPSIESTPGQILKAMKNVHHRIGFTYIEDQCVWIMGPGFKHPDFKESQKMQELYEKQEIELKRLQEEYKVQSSRMFPIRGKIPSYYSNEYGNQYYNWVYKYLYG